MDFKQHPQHDLFIGAPKNWDPKRDGPCGALSVHKVPNPPYQPTMESAWAPSIEEAIALAVSDYSIKLGVIGQVAHPVVYMNVSYDFNGDAGALCPPGMKEKLQRALDHLIAVADSKGFVLEARHVVRTESLPDHKSKRWEHYETNVRERIAGIPIWMQVGGDD